MARILHLTDTHLRTTTPRARNGDFLEDMRDKLLTVASITDLRGVDLLLCTGDIFDRPSPGIGAVNVWAKALAMGRRVESITITGQHDLVGRASVSLGSSAIGLLPHLSNHWEVISDEPTPGAPTRFWGPSILPIPYADDLLERLGNGYFVDKYESAEIALVHAMVVPEPVPWPHILIKDVKVPARVVLCGDYHSGFGVVEHNGQVFVNPGALARLSISERTRTPRVAIIDWPDGRDPKVELVDVPCREDAFLDPKDTTEIDGIGSFARLLTELGGDTSTPVEKMLSPEFLDSLGLDEGVPPDVLDEARRRIKAVEEEGVK